MKHGKNTVTHEIGKYSNGRISIRLRDEDGAPYAHASINLPSEEMKKKEVAIKNFGENEGVLDMLVKAGIVSKPVRTITYGFVDVPIVKLLK